MFYVFLAYLMIWAKCVISIPMIIYSCSDLNSVLLLWENLRNALWNRYRTFRSDDSQITESHEFTKLVLIVLIEIPMYRYASYCIDIFCCIMMLKNKRLRRGSNRNTVSKKREDIRDKKRQDQSTAEDVCPCPILTTHNKHLVTPWRAQSAWLKPADSTLLCFRFMW